MFNHLACVYVEIGAVPVTEPMRKDWKTNALLPPRIIGIAFCNMLKRDM